MSGNPENFEERIEVVREQFAALITADAYIGGVAPLPVITEKLGDIASILQEAMAKLGLCIVCVAADGDNLRRTGDTLSIRVRLVAQISEKVLINQANAVAAGTAYRPALAVAVRVMKAVDRKPNGLDIGAHLPGLNEFALPEDDGKPFELLKTPTDVVYAVSAYTTVEL